jgi:hypothetical protein
MSVTYQAIRQLLLSVEKLQPCEHNLSKLLALTVAAHQLLCDEETDTPRLPATDGKANPARTLEKVLDEKLYLPSKENPEQKFIKLKAQMLEQLRQYNQHNPV